MDHQHLAATLETGPTEDANLASARTLGGRLDPVSGPTVLARRLLDKLGWYGHDSLERSSLRR